jgi:hypothetical protein
LDGEGDVCYSLWAVYYRSNETAIPNAYSHEATVEVTVHAIDRTGEIMDPLSFRFRVQGQERTKKLHTKAPMILTIIDRGRAFDKRLRPSPRACWKEHRSFTTAT